MGQETDPFYLFLYLSQIYYPRHHNFGDDLGYVWRFFFTLLVTLSRKTYTERIQF